MTLKKNLILTGMMGSGKSTIGIVLAKMLNLRFLDIDKEIEKAENLTIKRIFDHKGEKYFRGIEEKIVLRELKTYNKVISLGGGGFLNKTIRKVIQKNHVSFWLNWKPEIIIKRIYKSKKRPLIESLSRKDIYNMIIDRSLIYKHASYKIDCDNLIKSQIAKIIIKKYEGKNSKY